MKKLTALLALGLLFSMPASSNEDSGKTTEERVQELVQLVEMHLAEHRRVSESPCYEGPRDMENSIADHLALAFHKDAPASNHSSTPILLSASRADIIQANETAEKTASVPVPAAPIASQQGTAIVDDLVKILRPLFKRKKRRERECVMERFRSGKAVPADYRLLAVNGYMDEAVALVALEDKLRR